MIFERIRSKLVELSRRDILFQFAIPSLPVELQKPLSERSEFLATEFLDFSLEGLSKCTSSLENSVRPTDLGFSGAVPSRAEAKQHEFYDERGAEAPKPADGTASAANQS